MKNGRKKHKSATIVPLRRKKRVLLLIESSRATGCGLIQGISQYVRQHNQWTIHIDEGRNMSESTVRRINHWTGDGIIARSFIKEIHQALVRHPCPFVELSGDGETVVADLRNDNEKIVELAVQHARELGYTRFAFYSFGDAWWGRERSALFHRNLQELGFSCKQLCQRYKKHDNVHPFWHRRFEPELKTWLRSLSFPIFLWAASDAEAIRVLEACLDLEIRVPEDIAILGTDNDSLLCNVLTPPLSTIQTDSVRIGLEAARLLDARMNGKLLKTTPRTFSPVGIVKRQSTDFMSIDDPDMVLAMQLIRERATDGLRVSDIAHQIALSQNTLCRRFHQFLGRTPEQEILRVRIERAKELLSLPDVNIEEVAEQTGFGATEYFMKVFLRKTGQTPTRYRESVRR